MKKNSSNFQLIFLLIFFIILAPSCASQEEKLELVKQEVEVINSKIDTKNMVRGLAFLDEKRFSYRGHFIDDELVYIYADVNIGVLSSSTYLLYFDNGKLIYFSQNEVGFDETSKRKRDIKADIYFDGKTVLESTKMIRGNYTDITDEEIEEIHKIAELLYNKAVVKKKAMTQK
jgi:hypothetical protein